MHNVLVFGYGFLGKHLVEELLNTSISVTVFDRNRRPKDLPRNLSWYQGDFKRTNDYKSLLPHFDVVFHLISTSVPSDTHIGIRENVTKNFEASVSLINACISAGVERIVFSSSASVYGEQTKIPIQENAATNPISMYGIQKLAIEKYILMQDRLGLIKGRIARIANPYGSYQSIMGRQGFIAIAIGKILSGKTITITQPNRTIRDFIHASDVSYALIKLALSEDAVIVNCGSGKGRSLADAISIISGHLSREADIIEESSTPYDILQSVLDIHLLRSIGAEPKISFNDGIKQVVEYHRARYMT